jgi:SpoVK/Ycf46/Vps4 family AAA+-type ATPase
MATAEQVKSLVRWHFSDEGELFVTAALQVAAHEAQQGHGELAHDIRNIIDKARRDQGHITLLRFPPELRGLVLSTTPAATLGSIVLPDELKNRIGRVIHEYRQQDKLKSHGLANRRKVLLVGPPGTGKTMTAEVLARELGLQLHTIQVDKLVTKFMGETAAKLRQIFELIQADRGVYLFDEFDAIGGERSLDNDVGEMRRVLNAFLQFIENDTSDSLIVAATNSPALLDRALFRRFDDVLYYHLPTFDAQQHLIENVLASFTPATLSWSKVKKASTCLSHADVAAASRDAVKQAILAGASEVGCDLLCVMLCERRANHGQARKKLDA